MILPNIQTYASYISTGVNPYNNKSVGLEISSYNSRFLSYYSSFYKSCGSIKLGLITVGYSWNLLGGWVTVSKHNLSANHTLFVLSPLSTKPWSKYD